jgi:hypothetical protein
MTLRATPSAALGSTPGSPAVLRLLSYGELGKPLTNTVPLDTQILLHS